MPWFKLCDRFHDHPKVVELRRFGRAGHAQAITLWVLAASCCACHLTDGEITLTRVRKLVPWRPERAIEALLAVKLWIQTGPETYQFHDWLDYQPSGEQEKKKRAADAKRKRKERSVRADRQRDSKRTPHVPTRPDPEPTETGEAVAAADQVVDDRDHGDRHHCTSDSRFVEPWPTGDPDDVSDPQADAEVRFRKRLSECVADLAGGFPVDHNLREVRRFTRAVLARAAALGQDPIQTLEVTLDAWSERERERRAGQKRFVPSYLWSDVDRLLPSVEPPLSNREERSRAVAKLRDDSDRLKPRRPMLSRFFAEEADRVASGAAVRGEDELKRAYSEWRETERSIEVLDPKESQALAAGLVSKLEA